MTSIVFIKQSHAVHILTDGAGYDGAGTLIGGAVKAWPVPSLNAVVAARGPAFFPALLATFAAAAAQTYDELKNGIASIARECFNTFEPLLALCDHGSDFDLVIAGWSERYGPDGYIMCNHGRNAPAILPWAVADTGSFALMPSNATVLDNLLRLFPQSRYPSADAIEPGADGLRVLEMQRALNWGHVIGGHATISTVTRDAISTRVLHRWPRMLGPEGT
jgi:hypothetical protein